MSFKNLKGKKARKNLVTINVGELSFTARRISFASPEFLGKFKEYVTANKVDDASLTEDRENWVPNSILGDYESDVNFLANMIVTDWSGFEDDDGNVVEYSPEMFREFFLNWDNEYEEAGVKDIFANILIMLSVPSTYAVSEDELKNS
jgi:hypothetical protein